VKRLLVLVAAVVVAVAGCGGSDSATPTTTAATATSLATSTTAASTTASSSPGASVGIATVPPAGGKRLKLGGIDLPVPAGWTVIPGQDRETMDGGKVKGSDWACLNVSKVDTDGVPFGCTGVLVLTGSAFDHAAEGSHAYDPDAAYQWYEGTDVPSCESAGNPLVQSKITESSLVPIGTKKAAFRRLDVGCEKHPTVFKAVSWTLPVSKIAVVSVFRGADAEKVWAGAALS
jgi:hypothetical protein